MTIRKLDIRTTEQIAAGEVVENPSSLVKELVENSLDAGAQKIRVSFKEGGLKEITIIDDGTGIPSQEVRLALKRHATSKISSLEDLGNIQTLGFRGEALPSIAAVSRLSITTRHQTEVSGVQAYFEGGREKTFQETGFAVGTRITARDLFYNTPARLKFLKGIPAETARIYRTIHWLALSRPDVSFSLYREDELLLETPGDGDLLNAIVRIYGSKLARELLALDFNEGSLSLYGYVSNPSFSRRSRNRQLFFVNQRYVRSKLLGEALDKSYGRIVTAKRFPAAFLFLTVSPEKLDINVHPAKTEVRFQNAEVVQRFLEQSLQEAFTPRSLWSPAVDTKVAWRKADERMSKEVERQRIKEQATSFSSPFSRESSNAVAKKQTTFVQNFLSIPLEAESLPFPEQNIQTIDGSIFNGFILGQVFATYLALVEGDDLILVDQHAAHERILWEKMQPQEKNEERYVQEIIPFTLELPPLVAEEFKGRMDLLKSLGLEIELFGHNTFIIRAVPFFLKDIFSAEMCRDIFEELSQEALSGQEFLKETLLQFACKAAIKANQVLAPEEMKSLLNRLERCENPHFCPHGRPVMVKISKKEIEKLFKRRG